MSKFYLTVLGAGTMVPTKELNPAGFLVEANHKKILMDAGPGIIRRLVDFGFNFQDIDLVFISHFHTDHFGDAFNLIHTRWIDDVFNKRKHKKLLLLGPKGIKRRFKLWRKIFWPEPKESYPVRFKEGQVKFEIDKIQIETFPVTHVSWFPSLGLILKSRGKKLVYTGDIGSRHDFHDLIEKTRNADLLITEASFKYPTPNHFTVQQIKKLVLNAKIKKILAVHIRPKDLKKVQKTCQRESKFILGKDNLRLKI